MQNNIGDIGARDLFEGVAVCDTLRQLGLAKNRIGDTGADGAAIMLTRNKVRALSMHHDAHTKIHPHPHTHTQQHARALNARKVV